MINRDWFRNVWHRVANDVWPTFQALKRFGLEDNYSDLHIVHLDWAKSSYEELYELVAPNSTFLRELPAEQNVVCFDDVIFMVSRRWHSTFPEGGSNAVGTQHFEPNAEVMEFGNWVVKRAHLSALQSSFVASKGREVTISWISRSDRPGNRAFKNEDKVLEQIAAALGDRVVIQKVILEDLSLKEQIAAVRTTDILFGMHGAGFTHIMWLPPHAVVVEVLPIRFMYLFYERVAKLSGRRYLGWRNDDEEDMVEMSWKPHTKFSNLILRPAKILPKFREALSMLSGKEEL